MNIDGKGKRFDEGKPMVHLIPADVQMAKGRVLAFGAEKYGTGNWERGAMLSKVVGPLLRHLYRWMSGEDIDKESREPHVIHVAVNADMLAAYCLRGIDKIAGGHYDDIRPKKQIKEDDK